MIRHVMSDGTRRDSIEGCVIPKDISESVLAIVIGRKGNRNDAMDETRAIRKE